MILFALPLNQQFYEALISEDITRMQYALEEGGDVDAIDNNGRPLLCVLLWEEKEKGIKFILDNGANINVVELTHSVNPVELTPLHLAAISGNPKLIKLLLGYNVDVNAITSGDNSLTPLSFAIRSNSPNKNKLEIVKLLLKHGADLYIKSKTNEIMAIHHAAEYGAIDVMQFLLKSKTNSSSKSSSSSLIKKTIDINIKDKLKRTPIDYAYIGNQKEMAVFLLSKGSLLPDYGRTKTRSVPFVIQALLEGDATLNTYRRVYQQLEDKINNLSTPNVKLINLARELKAVIDEKEQGIIIPMLRQRKIEEVEEVEVNDKIHISELPNDVLQIILSKAKILDPKKKSKSKEN